MLETHSVRAWYVLRRVTLCCQQSKFVARERAADGRASGTGTGAGTTPPATVPPNGLPAQSHVNCLRHSQYPVCLIPSVGDELALLLSVRTTSSFLRIDC